MDRPCIGIENGVFRTIELGEQGHHGRLNLHRVAEQYDAGDNVLGTWTICGGQK